MSSVQGWARCGHGRDGTVVVDKVGDADAEESAVQACIQTRDALAVNDAAGSIERGELRAFGFDLGACGEGDEGVTACTREQSDVEEDMEMDMDKAYVKAMDSSPPPAPASACATLSLCWAAVPRGSACVDSASFSCVFSCTVDMAWGRVVHTKVVGRARQQISRRVGRREGTRGFVKERVRLLHHLPGQDAETLWGPSGL